MRSEAFFVYLTILFQKGEVAMKKLQWMALDNAAKIFPAARRRNWSNVFRLSATLTEAVDKDALKCALEVTVRRFPSMAVRVRPGFFWYYIEQIPQAPEIVEEKSYPLVRMPFDDIRKCAFRVIVYDRRIAVEFFHAVTDGNGGLLFLKTLVAEYILQKYGVTVPCGDGILDRREEPKKEEWEDCFFRHAGPHRASRAESSAFRIIEKRERDGYKTNTTFILDANSIVEQAKRRGVTVTAYMAAVLVMAAMRVQEQQVRRRARRKPVKVVIPVDLRRMFQTKTLRNFALYATPGIDPRLGDYTFDEICDSIYHQMRVQITPQNMSAMIAKNVGDEKPLLLRLAPLCLKNIIMKMIFNAVGESRSCFSFSNLGVVRTPEEFSRFVERLDFVLGVQASAPYNTSAVTYRETMYLNIIRNIQEPVLERQIYAVLREQGLKVRVESNSRGGEV